jgi:hypothetical protein
MPRLASRPITRLLGLGLTAACLVYFSIEARKVLSGTHLSWADSRVLDGLPIAAGLYLAAYAVLAIAWHCLLRSLAVNPGLRSSAGIYLAAQIAKYIPGNVGQHIGRIYLSTARGLPGTKVVMAMLLEILLGLVVAALLSLPLAPMMLRYVRAASFSWTSLAVVAAGLAAIACLAAYALHRKRLLVPLRNHLRDALREARGSGGAKFLAGATALIVVGTILAGLALVALASPSVAVMTVPSIIAGVALFCASWILGFLAPGAPAGLGIREAILLGGLTPAIGGTLALEVTILFRGLSVAADLVAWLVGAMLLRRAVKG